MYSETHLMIISFSIEFFHSLLQDLANDGKDSHNAQGWETCISLNLLKDSQQNRQSNGKLVRHHQQRPRYHHHEKLRIVRTDIRRNYPIFFRNVLNSSDPQMISKFCYEFCSPNLIYEGSGRKGQFGQIVDACLPRPVLGNENAAKAAIAYLTSDLLSDRVIRLQDASMHATAGVPGSKLINNYLVEITLLYHVQRIPAQNYQLRPKVFPSLGLEILDPVTNDVVLLTVLPQPVKLKIFIEFIMYVDDTNHICTIIEQFKNTISLPMSEI